MTDKSDGAAPREPGDDPHGQQDEARAVAGQTTPQPPAPEPATPDPPTTPNEPANSAPRYWTKEFYLPFVGIVATVAAAITTQYFTYKANRESLEATQQQSSIEFQREERKSAYGELLAKTLLLADAEAKVDTLKYRNPIDQINQKWLDELNKWQAASDQMWLFRKWSAGKGGGFPLIGSCR